MTFLASAKEVFRFSLQLRPRFVPAPTSNYDGLLAFTHLLFGPDLRVSGLSSEVHN